MGRGVVQVEGNELFLQTHDIKLDDPERRVRPSGHRRALVHDHQDGLTINYNGDYPGGVKIKGTTICDTIRLQGMRNVFDTDSVAHIITALKRQIDALESRIETLERR
ncbi:hypothetical protein [Kordia jejudonensis]|uniref:hypothetical protein n=1 Tax=Kordia jejudonensis TaxID=1348245 RepID=UPI0012E034A8|nr:hypothetical protein [Kordia jejudonensis]